MSERGALTLELSRALPASPHAVFAAFCEPAELSRWWGPRGFRVPSVDFDPRVGAAYRIEMQPPEGAAFYLVGEFRAVDPPTRLAFTFLWEPPHPDDVETVADLSFHEDKGSTKVAFAQGAFKTDERRSLHRDGWSETLDRLEQHLLSETGESGVRV